MKADVEGHEILQLLHGRAAGVMGRLGQQVGHMRLHQIEQQALLVGRVVIERSGLHADFGGDGAHRHGSIAAPRKKPQRSRADARASDIGV